MNKFDEKYEETIFSTINEGKASGSPGFPLDTSVTIDASKLFRSFGDFIEDFHAWVDNISDNTERIFFDEKYEVPGDRRGDKIRVWCYTSSVIRDRLKEYIAYKIKQLKNIDVSTIKFEDITSSK